MRTTDGSPQCSTPMGHPNLTSVSDKMPFPRTYNQGALTGDRILDLFHSPTRLVYHYTTDATLLTILSVQIVQKIIEY